MEEIKNKVEKMFKDKRPSEVMFDMFQELRELDKKILCKGCGRHLKSEHSIKIGFGSVCFKKSGLQTEKKIEKKKVKGYF